MDGRKDRKPAYVNDAEGKMNLSVLDVKGEVIVVSQFTLFADAQKGRRPSFVDAARPEVAAPLVDRFAELIREQGVPTQTGIFGADMQVEIHNDGPVAVWLENEDAARFSAAFHAPLSYEEASYFYGEGVTRWRIAAPPQDPVQLDRHRPCLFHDFNLFFVIDATSTDHRDSHPRQLAYCFQTSGEQTSTPYDLPDTNPVSVDEESCAILSDPRGADILTAAAPNSMTHEQEFFACSAGRDTMSGNSPVVISSDAKITSSANSGAKPDSTAE